MSDAGEQDGRPSAPGELDASADQAVRELVRGAIAEPEALPDLTRGVQQKLRVRSGGKFYADGWSTAKHPPLNTYLITSLMMLFASCVIYALLAPLAGAPDVAKPPRSVNVVSPP